MFMYNFEVLNKILAAVGAIGELEGSPEYSDEEYSSSSEEDDKRSASNQEFSKKATFPRNIVFNPTGNLRKTLIFFVIF